MSETFKKIIELIEKGEVIISNHGYDELAEEGLMVKEIIASVMDGKVVEDYPEYPKGPCTLYCKEIAREILYMWYGVFRRMLRRLLY